MKKAITQEDVDRICDKLRAEGKNPTGRTVQAEHGGGSSMSTVYPMLNNWKARNPETERAVNMSEPLLKALSMYLGQEIEQGKAALRAELAVLEETNQDLATEARLKDEQLTAQEAEHAQLHDQVTALTAQVAQLEVDVAAAQAETERERAAGERARIDLAMASARLEGVPQLEAELAQCRLLLASEGQARVLAEQQAAVASAARDGVQARLDDEKARSAQLQTQLAAEQAKVDKLHKEAAQSNVHYEAARGRLEAAEARMTNAEGRASKYRDEAKEANARAASLDGQLTTVQAVLADTKAALANATAAPAKEPGAKK
jgi:chromosome segregation ATPase